MANLSFRHLYKIYPARKRRTFFSRKKAGDDYEEFAAVKDFTMDIADGEFVVIVGPSGCGKSTTLRMVAGLEEISAGELYIDGQLVNNVESKDRDIAMVFQSYALYPQMSAFDNIAFGLKIRKIKEEVLDENGKVILIHDAKEIGQRKKEIRRLQKNLDKEKRKAEANPTKIEGLQQKKSQAEDRLAYLSTHDVPLCRYRHLSKTEIAERVTSAAKILGIETLLNRKPSEMSGGQMQRVALGRALVRGPKAFLLDEPLSNLDAKLRSSMRGEIVKLHQELKATFIYVTHDQIEAMTMGSKIVVMKDGLIQQVSSPTDLFDYPENRFVASFIGTPQMNFFAVEMQKEGDDLRFFFASGESLLFPLAALRPIEKSYLDGNKHPLVLGARGEHLVLGDNGLSAVVEFCEVLGSDTHVNLRIEGVKETIIACAQGRPGYALEQKIHVNFDPAHLYLFDRPSEKSIIHQEMKA